MTILVFVICGDDECIFHLTGYRNAFENCYIAFCGFWITISNEIFVALEALEQDDGNPRQDEAIMLTEILRDLRLQLASNHRLTFEALIMYLDVVVKKTTGDWPHTLFENLLEKLENLEVYQPLLVAPSPCECQRDMQETDLFYLDLLDCRTLEGSLRNRFILAEDDQYHLNCTQCNDSTLRTKRAIITRLPEYLPLKFSENQIYILPIRFRIPEDIVTRRLRRLVRSSHYEYAGHCFKEGGLGDEHSIAVLSWGGRLHRLNNEQHLTCEIPADSITVTSLDMAIYRLVRDPPQAKNQKKKSTKKPEPKCGKGSKKSSGKKGTKYAQMK